MMKTAGMWMWAKMALTSLSLSLALAACGGETLSVPPEADAGVPDSGPASVVIPPDCGDGVIQVTKGETCDDGNTASGDGCSDQCLLEEGWLCPRPGEPCLPPSRCGDGRLDPARGETCDDGNTASSDGCSSDCQLELGWACPYAGSACRAALCGDGITAGSETCDPPGEGCSDNCQVLPGFACDSAGCHAAVCGDGVKEGDEACDLGEGNAWGQGCTPDCQIELSCPASAGSLGSACTALCGSGMMLLGDTSKACDDGNLTDGDGCSSTCTIEAGWTCEEPAASELSSLTLPIIYRDFIGQSRRAEGSSAPIHPDFNVFSGSGTRELVQGYLDGDGKPAFRQTVGVGETGPQLNSDEYFRLWYRDDPHGGVTYSKRVVSSLTLAKISDSPVTYQFSSTGFFPVDGQGWTASGDETVPSEAPHNYSFTSEIHYWFQFQGGEVLSFYGDDDLWVFVNNRLALDLGGLHAQQSGSFTINVDGTITSTAFVGSAREHTAANVDFGLAPGKLYEIAIFHAERRQTGSNYQLTLAGFNAGKSVCTPICGDGIVTRAEVCDDGAEANTGGYGKCLPTCQGYGPRCGDGTVDAEYGETCDDGPKNGTDESQCSLACLTSGGFL